ncbi:MAG: hypothetical protein JXP34_21670 [Planctomycetes bacterium]|nr:hypothetical protein [Planctomycetota bacterium]
MERLRGEEDPEDPIATLVALLRFLQAEGVEERAKLAAAFTRVQWVDPFLRGRLADRLIREGAPPSVEPS